MVQVREQAGQFAAVARSLGEAAASRGVGVVSAAGARVRSARVFHPRGETFHGVLDVSGAGDFGAPLLDRPGRRRALVRLSKAAGAPWRLPDVLGLAFRVDDPGQPGKHVDFALATAGQRPGLRHVLMPANDFAAATYSSVLPYEIGGRQRLIGALPVVDPPSLPVTLSDLRKAVAEQPVSFRIAVAELFGPWEPVGTLTLEVPAEITDDELCFDVISNQGVGIKPIGWLQRVRLPAYRGSQRGRDADCRDLSP